MIDLIHNLSMLVALSILSGFVLRRVGDARGGRFLQGLLFGGAAVISMIDPLHLAPGLHFDSRSVAVSICGLYFGPVAALVSMAMASICRILQGGVGAPTGVFVALIPGLIGIGCHYWWRHFQGKPGVLRLWAMGMAVHVVVLLLLFTLPDNGVWKVLPKVWFSVIILFPAATILIGAILTDQRISAQAAARLRAEHAQLYATLYGMKDAVMATDSRGKITLMNRMAERLAGWTEREARGKALETVYSLLDEESRSPASVSVSDVLTGKDSKEAPNRGILVDRGEHEHLVSQSIATIDDDGGAVVVFRDRREEFEAIRALKNARARFERALDHIPDVFVIYDRDLRIQYINQATRAVSGRPESDFIGARDDELWPPAVYESYLPTLERCLETRALTTVEIEVEIPDAGFRSLLITCVPVLDQEGALLEVLGITRDRTEAKEAERVIRESESLLRIAGKAARVGGWIVELGAERVIWSEEMYAIYELPRDYVPIVDEAMTYFPPEWRRVLLEHFEGCMTAGRPYDFELELNTAGGRRIWVRAIGQAVRDESGTIVRVQGAVQDISKIKDAEKSLAQSEERFRQLADAMPLVVLTATPDGTVDYTSQALSVYTGLTAPGEVALHWMEAIYSEDLEPTRDRWFSACRDGLYFVKEVRIRRHDGEYRWNHMAATPIRDESGVIVKWYGTMTDIHDTKLNEAAMTRMAQRLSNTLESITDAFYTLDREFRFTYLNSEAERLMQQTRMELIGKTVAETFPETVDSEFYRKLNFAMTEDQSVEMEYYYGPLRSWFELHIYPSEEGVAVYFRDITDRIVSDQELREVTSRLQGFLDFAPLFLAELDLEGRFLLTNKAHDILFGANVTGKKLTDILPPDKAAFFQGAIDVVASGGLARTIEDDLETQGETRSLAIIFFPLCDNDGQVTSVGGIAEDVTRRKHDMAERKRLETQLHQAQKMEAVGRLAGGVAHDFNNMLSVILGYTEMALMGMDGEDSARADIEQVQMAAVRSADLTKQLLAFARKQVIEPSVVDINKVVESILKMLGRLVGEEIELTWVPGSGLWPIHADPTQIDQVLANLVVNARDAISGHGKLVIETAGETFSEDQCEGLPGATPGAYIRLSIRDDGCGMDESTVTQIFEPFFTTKPMGQGTGLGLATVYGIARQNGGFVTVESEEGVGSTFNFYLPRHRMPSDIAEGKIEKSGGQGGSETILFVEDEMALLTLGKLQIERLGYTVLTANSAQEGLRVAQSHEGFIDLLITDVIMPEMNGRELAQALEAIRPGLKTLFMSGYTAEVIEKQGVLEPGIHFIQKPFRGGKMAAKIREVLDSTIAT